jgi:predicted RNA-binding protein
VGSGAGTLVTKTRYWIGVASREHVRLGVKRGFAQFNHGKLGPARRLSRGDWVIYYSGREKFGEPELCQKFTAIGQVVDAEPIQIEQFPGFKPYRRKIKYRKATEADIHPLIDRLSFIKNKSRWGIAFRFGFLEINQSDFAVIAKHMLPRARSA